MRKNWGHPDAVREKPLILVSLESGYELVSFLFNRRDEMQLSYGPRVNNRHLLGRIQMRTRLQRIEAGLVRGQKNQSLSQDRFFLEPLKKTLFGRRPRKHVLSEQNE